MDALAAYFQIKIRKKDRHKTTFMLHSGRYFFRKTVMGNRLSSDTWLRARDEVIENLDGVFKLVDDLIIVERTTPSWQRGLRRCSSGAGRPT